MNSTEILLLFGHALGMTLDDQQDIIADMTHIVPEGDTPVESVNRLTKGMDTKTLYTGVLLYKWLMATYGDNGDE